MCWNHKIQRVLWNSYTLLLTEVPATTKATKRHEACHTIDYRKIPEGTAALVNRCTISVKSRVENERFATVTRESKCYMECLGTIRLKAA